MRNSLWQHSCISRTNNDLSHVRLLKVTTMEKSEESHEIEHAELIDMRTHLTVAMLAAAQLHRKTQHLPEAAHLQCYLDHSLKSLIDDVGKVDALIANVEIRQPASAEQRPHSPPLPLRWGFALLKHGTRALWGLAHHRQQTRLTALYLCR